MPYLISPLLIPEQHGKDAFGPRLENLVHMDDMEEEVWNTISSMIEEAKENDVFMRHLLAGLLRVKGSHSRLIADMHCGILHPTQSTPYFETVPNESNYSLKKRRDFLKRGLGQYFQSEQPDTQQQ